MSSRIKDIAEHVGLSPATVSMVLNNRPGFSDETRAKVMEAARHFNYQSLSSKKALSEVSENLPFVIYKKHGEVVAETPFFSSLIEALESRTKVLGYNLSIHYLYADEGNFPSSLAQIGKPDLGLLILATEMDKEEGAALEELGIPYVLIDNALTGVTANKVLMNNQQGAYCAVEEFYAMGHRRIGYLHSRVWISNFEERETGFRLAMRRHGLELREDWIIPLGCTHESALRDMLRHCEEGAEMPTALFADNDIIAMGAINALLERGYRVPDDISVIGFDDMPYCTMISPALSTMRVDTQSIGAEAVRLLLEKNNYRLKVEVETKLIRRQSVRQIV